MRNPHIYLPNANASIPHRAIPVGMANSQILADLGALAMFACILVVSQKLAGLLAMCT